MSDLIRREDVDKAIWTICNLCGEEKRNNGVMCGACNLDSFVRVYDDLPSAEPERKTGKWVDVKINSYTSRMCCSECGSSAPFIYKSDDYYSNHAHGETARTKFCPNCGADMRDEK